MHPSTTLEASEHAWIDTALETVGPFGPVSTVRKLLRRPCDYPVHMWAADYNIDLVVKLPDVIDRLPSCGVGLTSEAALASALGEVFERFVFANRSPDLQLVISPGSLDIASTDLASLPLFVSPYASTRDALASCLKEEKRWIALANWTPDGVTGSFLKVPASLIFAAYATEALPASSSGMAAGPSVEFAVLRGITELVERDAVMTAWAHRFPGKRIDVSQLLSERVVDWISRLDAINIGFRLYDISSVPGFYTLFGIVVPRKRDNPVGICCGAGCSLDPHQAALRAFLEASLSWRGASELLRLRGSLSEKEIEQYHPVSFTDHLYLYQHPTMLEAASFLLDAEIVGEVELPQHRFSSYREELVAALNLLSDCGFRVYAHDMTPPDLFDLHIKVVRVIIPGLVPLSWGNYSPLPSDRLLKPEHIPKEAWQDPLNPNPHPFP